MANRNYANGRAFEYEIMREFRDCGYECIRAAGSHGPWDVICWNREGFIFIQAKRGCRPSKAEMAKMRESRVPDNSTKWVYLRKPYKPLEMIHIK